MYVYMIHSAARVNINLHVRNILFIAMLAIPGILALDKEDNDSTSTNVHISSV